MKTTYHNLAAVGLSVVLGFLCAGPCQAGPAEEYNDGAKRYGDGDLIAAMPLLRKSADAGHAAAQAMLAEILDQSDSSAEAVDYFRKAALQGNADGQFGLGALLAAGQGAPKDAAEGRKWILLAAEQGHKLAINELASAYIVGGLDIPDNARQSAEALRWIRTAAENEYLQAMERLAAAYRNGEFGLAADVKTAAQWEGRINKVRGIRQGQRNKKRSTEQ